MKGFQWFWPAGHEWIVVEQDVTPETVTLLFHSPRMDRIARRVPVGPQSQGRLRAAFERSEVVRNDELRADRYGDVAKPFLPMVHIRHVRPLLGGCVLAFSVTWPARAQRRQVSGSIEGDLFLVFMNGEMKPGAGQVVFLLPDNARTLVGRFVIYYFRRSLGDRSGHAGVVVYRVEVREGERQDHVDVLGAFPPGWRPTELPGPGPA